jgi:hypothetical protein
MLMWLRAHVLTSVGMLVIAGETAAAWETRPRESLRVRLDFRDVRERAARCKAAELLALTPPFQQMDYDSIPQQGIILLMHLPNNAQRTKRNEPAVMPR